MLLLAFLVACGDEPTDPPVPVTTATTPTGTVTATVVPPGLLWPIACIPGGDCYEPLGYADFDGDGIAWDCGPAGYPGHAGVDIAFSDSVMDWGIPILAAADGVVTFVFDGHHDRCHVDTDHPDCADPGDWAEPGQTNGFRRCTELSSDLCGLGTDPSYQCFWCFDSANLVVIEHPDHPHVFATVYGHLKKDAIAVAPGDTVTAGQPIAYGAAAGRVTGPHLHFEVLGPTGWYAVTDPWSGDCSPPGDEAYLWEHDPPWQASTTD